jgi:hypothetical protein
MMTSYLRSSSWPKSDPSRLLPISDPTYLLDPHHNFTLQPLLHGMHARQSLLLYRQIASAFHPVSMTILRDPLSAIVLVSMHNTDH